MKLLYSFVVLLFAGMASAADPKIISLNPVSDPLPPPPPIIVKEGALRLSYGKMQVLSVKGVDKAIKWNVVQPLADENTRLDVVDYAEMPKGSIAFGYMEGDKAARKQMFSSDVLCLVGTGKGDGLVTVQALVVENGQIKVVADVVIYVTGNLPVPPVPPTPNPPNPNPPNPTPPVPVTPQKLFVVIIEETADAVANRGAMLADKDLNARMKDKGHKWRIADKDVVDSEGKPPADLVRFLEASKGKNLPQLFLVDEKGKTLKQLDLPKTASGLLEEIKKVGG